MIPKCIVALAHCCYPTERYDLAYKKADQETHPSSYADKVVTPVAFGALGTLCLGCPFAGCPTHPDSVTIYKELCMGSTTACCAIDIFRAINPDNKELSTGCIRDFTVLNKTFTSNKIDRVV